MNDMDMNDIDINRIRRSRPINCLSHWFPLIRDAGLPVPRTKIVTMTAEVQDEALRAVFDGSAFTEVSASFFRSLKNAARSVGFPCFLRSGHTSAKHEWNKSCYVPDSDGARWKARVQTIVRYGEIQALVGPPINKWVVREFLPIEPVATCPSYHEMPVCREFRVFVNGADVVCHHPYWPMELLERGNVSDAPRVFEELQRLSAREHENILSLAAAAGKAVGGAWSVDVLKTQRGWVITDMALAEQSFHWEGCERMVA